MAKQDKINEFKIKAKNLLIKNKYDEAIKLYEKIIELAPDDLKLLTELAEIYVKKGDNSTSKKIYWKLLDSYRSLDYYSNAIAIAQKLLKLGEDELQMLEIVADLYAKQGLLGDATSAYYRIAERFSKENDINGVLSTYKKIVELIPKKTDIREQLVKIFISQNKQDDALEQLNILYEIYKEQGRVEESDRIQDTISSLKGEKPKAEKKEEEIVFEQSKTVFAEETVTFKKEEPTEKKVVKKKEEEEEEVSIISALEESIEEQKKELRKEREIPEPDIKSIEKSVTDWMDWLTVAQLYESIGSNEDAVDYYSKAADYFFDTGDLSKAEETYKKISDLKPYEIRPIQKLIQIALRINDKNKAVEAYVALYNCLTKRGAEEEAKNALDKAIKIDPSHPLLKEIIPQEEEAVKLEGIKKEEVGISFEDLLKEEEKGITIKIEEKVPGEENIEYLLTQFKQKIFENISAEDYSSHYDLGLTYKEMGLIDEAISQFKISMKGQKEKFKSLEMLGKCYEEKGELKTAEIIYKKTIENEKGKNPLPLLAFHYHLGILYATQNRINEAINEFKEIIKIDPNFGDVKEKIKELNTLLIQSKTK